MTPEDVANGTLGLLSQSPPLSLLGVISPSTSSASCLLYAVSSYLWSFRVKKQKHKAFGKWCDFLFTPSLALCQQMLDASCPPHTPRHGHLPHMYPQPLTTLGAAAFISHWSSPRPSSRPLPHPHTFHQRGPSMITIQRLQAAGGLYTSTASKALRGWDQPASMCTHFLPSPPPPLYSTHLCFLSSPPWKPAASLPLPHDVPASF